MVNLGLAIGLPLGLLALIALGLVLGYLYWRHLKRKKGSWNRREDPEVAGVDRERKKSDIIIRQPSKEGGEIYVVRHFHEAENEEQLTLHTGRFVEVLEKSEDGWWRGTIDDRTGWFPANFVRPISVTDKGSLPSEAKLVIQEETEEEKGEDNKALDVSREEETPATDIQSDKDIIERDTSGKLTPNGHIKESLSDESKPEELSDKDTKLNGHGPLLKEEVTKSELQGVESSVTQNDKVSPVSEGIYSVPKNNGPVYTGKAYQTQHTDSETNLDSGYDNLVSGGYDNVGDEHEYDKADINVKSGYDNLTTSKLRLTSKVEDDDLYEGFDEVNTVKCAIITAKGKSGSSDTLDAAEHICSMNERQLEELNVKRAQCKYFVAMYPFVGSTTEQLSLRPNDVIRVLGDGGELNGWMKGELQGSDGLHGWFPASYVREAKSPRLVRKQDSPLPALEISQAESDDTLESTFMEDGEFQAEDDVTGLAYRSLYPYEAQQEGDLSFGSGETIIVLETLDNGWWRGCCRDQEGWFPGTYVEAIPQTPGVGMFGAPSFPTETVPPIAFSSPRQENQQDGDQPTLNICTSPVAMPASPEPETLIKPGQKPVVPKRFVVPKLVKIPKATFSSLTRKKVKKGVSPSGPAPLPPAKRVSKENIQVVTAELPPEEKRSSLGKRSSLSRPSVPPPQPPPDSNRLSQEETMQRLADLVANQEVIVHKDEVHVSEKASSDDLLEGFKLKYALDDEGSCKSDNKRTDTAGEFDSILASLNKDIATLYDSVADELNTSDDFEQVVPGSNDFHTCRVGLEEEVTLKTKSTVNVAIQPDTNVKPVMEVRPYVENQGQKAKTPPRPALPDVILNGRNEQKDSPPSPVKSPPKRPEAPPRGISATVMQRIKEKQEAQRAAQKDSDNYGLFERTRPPLPPKPSPSKVRKYKRSHSDLGLSTIVARNEPVPTRDDMVHEKLHSKPPRPLKPPRYTRSKSLGSLQYEVELEELPVSFIDSDIFHLTGTETCVDTGETISSGEEEEMLAPPEGFENDHSVVILATHPGGQELYPVDQDPSPKYNESVYENIHVGERNLDLPSTPLQSFGAQIDNRDIGATPKLMLQTQRTGLSSFSDPNADTLTPAKESYGLMVHSKDVGMTPKIMLQYKDTELTEYGGKDNESKKTLNFDGTGQEGMLENVSQSSTSTLEGPQKLSRTSFATYHASFEGDVNGKSSGSLDENRNLETEGKVTMHETASAHTDAISESLSYGSSTSNASQQVADKSTPEGTPAKVVSSAQGSEHQRHLRFYTPAGFVPRATIQEDTVTNDPDVSYHQPARSSLEIRSVRPVLEPRQRTSYSSDEGNIQSPHSSLVDLSSPRPYKPPSLSSPESGKDMAPWSSGASTGVLGLPSESIEEDTRQNEPNQSEYIFHHENVENDEGEESIV